MATKPGGNTFRPIDLDAPTLLAMEYEPFVKELRARVSEVKQLRFDWYEQQVRLDKWVNGLRRWMVWLGAAGTLATAVATGLRIYSTQMGWLKDSQFDIALLLLAMFLYAAMGAVSFYEKMSEGAGSYFRSIMAVTAIRDLWTSYQFKEAALMLQPPATPADVPAAKQRWLDAAEPFCKALDAIATQELTEWRGAFQAAMGQLATSATAGLAAGQTALTDALRSAVDAAKTAIVNLTVGGTATGPATVRVDGRIVTQGSGRSFALTGLAQGNHVIRVEIDQGAGNSPKTAEQAVSLPAGITALSLAPS